MPTNHIVIYSGGMDSFTLLHSIRLRVADLNKMRVAYLDNNGLAHFLFALSFDYGQRHSRELTLARKVTDSLGIVHPVLNLQVLGSVGHGSALTDSRVNVPHGHYADDNMRKTVVPGRNTVMLAMAMAFAEGLSPYDRAVIYYGAHAGDHHIYPDCRPEFVGNMQDTITAASAGRVRLEAPFLHIDKAGILTHGLRLCGLKPEDYTNTYSCYEGGEKPCGKCGACTERAYAFEKNHVVDPLLA